MMELSSDSDCKYRTIVLFDYEHEIEKYSFLSSRYVGGGD